MFLRINDRIINSDQIVEVEIHPAETEGGSDLPPSTPLFVMITTTAFEGDADETASGWTLRPHTIVLDGEEAELFLAALPVYEPVCDRENDKETPGWMRAAMKARGER